MPPAGKKYVVEAFVEFGMDDTFTIPTVLVKYEQHDDPEWEPVSSMRDQLAPAFFNFLMGQLKNKA